MRWDAPPIPRGPPTAPVTRPRAVAGQGKAGPGGPRRRAPWPRSRRPRPAAHPGSQLPRLLPGTSCCRDRGAGRPTRSAWPRGPRPSRPRPGTRRAAVRPCRRTSPSYPTGVPGWRARPARRRPAGGRSTRSRSARGRPHHRAHRPACWACCTRGWARRLAGHRAGGGRAAARGLAADPTQPAAAARDPGPARRPFRPGHEYPDTSDGFPRGAGVARLARIRRTNPAARARSRPGTGCPWRNRLTSVRPRRWRHHQLPLDRRHRGESRGAVAASPERARRARHRPGQNPQIRARRGTATRAAPDGSAGPVSSCRRTPGGPPRTTSPSPGRLRMGRRPPRSRPAAGPRNRRPARCTSGIRPR